MKRRSFIAGLLGLPAALLGWRRMPWNANRADLLCVEETTVGYCPGTDGYVQGATDRWNPTTGHIERADSLEWVAREGSDSLRCRTFIDVS